MKCFFRRPVRIGRDAESDSGYITKEKTSRVRPGKRRWGLFLVLGLLLFYLLADLVVGSILRPAETIPVTLSSGKIVALPRVEVGHQISVGMFSRPAAGEESLLVTLDVTVADASVRTMSAETWGDQQLQTKKTVPCILLGSQRYTSYAFSSTVAQRDPTEYRVALRFTTGDRWTMVYHVLLYGSTVEESFAVLNEVEVFDQDGNWWGTYSPGQLAQASPPA